MVESYSQPTAPGEKVPTLHIAKCFGEDGMEPSFMELLFGASLSMCLA